MTKHFSEYKLYTKWHIIKRFASNATQINKSEEMNYCSAARYSMCTVPQSNSTSTNMPQPDVLNLEYVYLKRIAQMNVDRASYGLLASHRNPEQ